MKTVLLLALLSLPAYAQAPAMPDILITGEERQAIIDKFGAMGDAIDKLGKALNNCRMAHST